VWLPSTRSASIGFLLSAARPCRLRLKTASRRSTPDGENALVDTGASFDLTSRVREQ